VPSKLISLLSDEGKEKSPIIKNIIIVEKP
jgi:hypothetical protein